MGSRVIDMDVFSKEMRACVNCHKGKTFIETVHMRHPDNIGDMIVQMGSWLSCECNLEKLYKQYVRGMPHMNSPSYFYCITPKYILFFQKMNRLLIIY